MIVDKFCCCSLKTGAITVGVIFLVFGLIDACMNCVGFTGDQQMMTALWLNIDIDNDGEADDFFMDRNKAMAALVVTLIFNILRILVGSSLIYGASNNKPAFILPVLVLIIADLVAGWVSSIFILFAFGGIFAIIIIALVIRSVLWGYFWVCIFSFWKQLKEEAGKRKESIETPAIVEETQA